MDSSTSLALSPEKLGDEIVHLYVGPQEKKFTVHKKLLCDRCPYFAGAFNTSFQEALENVIKFPEEDPDAMAAVVDFIYRSVIDEEFMLNENPTREERTNYFTRLAKAYVLGEKLCFDQFMNRLLDNYWHSNFRTIASMGFWEGTPDILPEWVGFIYRNTHSESRLRRTVAVGVARMLCVTGPYPWPSIRDDEEEVKRLLKDINTYIEAVKDIPDLCADIFRLSITNSVQVESDPCYYHVHASGKGCDREEVPTVAW